MIKYEIIKKQKYKHIFHHKTIFTKFSKHHLSDCYKTHIYKYDSKSFK